MSRAKRGLLEELQLRDVEFLWSIQDYVYRWPALDMRMSMLVSKQPWNDIGLVMWLVALVGCIEIGVRHFWVVTVNIGAAFVANRMIRSKRPVEYDARLQPTTDLHPDSYGLPSLESYMSVVVVGHFFKSTQSWLFLLLGVPLALLIGFSRVYSRARLPHQIVASYVLGLVGLLLGTHYCENMGGGFHNMPAHSHGVWLGVVVVIFLANLALNMENNDSRLLYVSRADFLRVVRGIMYAGGDPAGEAGGGAMPRYDGGGEDEADAFMDTAPAPPAGSSSAAGAALNEGYRQAQERHMLRSGGMSSRKAKSATNRKDSFYFLQKQLQARAGAAGAGMIASSPRNRNDDGRDFA